MKVEIYNMIHVGSWAALKEHPNWLYVGRRKEGREHYGNPFTHLQRERRELRIVKTRSLAIRAFDEWLKGRDKYAKIEPYRRGWILEQLPQLSHVEALLCWCSPMDCHAWTIRNRLWEIHGKD